MNTSSITYEEELFQKLQSYCAYRERCSFEVMQKLRRMGAGKLYIEKIADRLRKEGFLNDKRFTEVYVRSKIFNNNWGKIKIKHHLRQLNIPEDYITSTFNSLDEEEYNNNLKKIIKKRYAELKDPDKSLKKNKTANYCIQKGFEAYRVWELISNTINN